MTANTPEAMDERAQAEAMRKWWLGDSVEHNSFIAWHSKKFGRQYTKWDEQEKRFNWDLTNELWACWQARANLPPPQGDAAAIRNAALEEAAYLCDEMGEHWSAYKDTALLNGDVELSNAASGEPRAAESLAALIRGMKISIAARLTPGGQEP